MTEDAPCHRLKREIVTSLSGLSAVRFIASFGSLAEGRADRWSDVDLLVACDEVASTQWMAAAAIHAAKRVCFYRMFSGAPQPSGRYWFSDESPFHRLDISFYAIADYQTLCREGFKSGHAIRVREEYAAAASPDADRVQSTPPAISLAVIQPFESDAGRRLYLHLEAAKARLRGSAIGKHDVHETRAALLRTVENCDAETFGGGDFLSLARKCLNF